MRCPWCGDEGRIIDCKRCGGRHCEHNVIRCNRNLTKKVQEGVK